MNSLAFSAVLTYKIYIHLQLEEAAQRHEMLGSLMKKQLDHGKRLVSVLTYNSEFL